MKTLLLILSSLLIGGCSTFANVSSRVPAANCGWVDTGHGDTVWSCAATTTPSTFSGSIRQ